MNVYTLILDHKKRFLADDGEKCFEVISETEPVMVPDAVKVPSLEMGLHILRVRMVQLHLQQICRPLRRGEYPMLENELAKVWDELFPNQSIDVALCTWREDLMPWCLTWQIRPRGYAKLCWQEGSDIIQEKILIVRVQADNAVRIRAEDAPTIGEFLKDHAGLIVPYGAELRIVLI